MIRAITMRLRLVVMACTLLLVLMSCHDHGQSSDRADAAGASDQFGVALLLSGSPDDHEWNQAGYDGLRRVERELGARIAHADNVPEGQREETFRRYAREGYDFVIGHGGEFLAAARKVSDEFPNTAFAIIGSDAGNNRNFGALWVRAQEIGYMTGVVAGLRTETQKVATIGGEPYPHMLELSESFERGVHSVLPSAQVATRWTHSWTEDAPARAIARELIHNHYDVLVANIDHPSAAVLDEVRRARVWAIGMPSDKHAQAPDAVVTSAVFHIDELLVRGATLVQKGRWEGRYYRFGLADGAFELTPIHGLDSEKVERVRRLKEDILRGRLDVEREPGSDVHDAAR